MAYEMQPNTGNFWLSPKIRQSKSGKDYNAYSGQVRITCPNCSHTHEFWLNGIEKDTKVGKLADLRVKVKEEKQVNVDNVAF